MVERKLRFLFTAPRYHTNQHFAVKALLDAGHEVSFLALRRGQSEVYDALHPIVLGKSFVFRLWCQMRSLKPDVVIVRNPTHSAYGLLSVITAKMVGASVIFYNQSPLHRPLKWWKRRLVRLFPTWAARIKWMTPVLGSPDQHPPAFETLRYVPFVMEPQTAPEQKRWFQGGTVNILCIGKFQRRKNHRLFLQAVAHLSKGYRMRATIIGECTTVEHQHILTELREYRADLGLNDRVCFRINLPFADVQREYPRHDLFVLPSRDEQAAVSILEAMAHTLPVICSDSNGTKCYIRPGENGFVFRTDDINDLVKCMERIISDRNRLAEMGARSYQLVVSEHAPEKYVRTILAIAGGPTKCAVS